MSIRTEKVAEQIKHQISYIIPREIDMTNFGIVTVTEVHVTNDLKLAKVYLSVFNSTIRKTDVLAHIQRRKKEIRMALGHGIHLKFTPDIVFYLDDTLDRVEYMEEIFRKIHAEEKPQ